MASIQIINPQEGEGCHKIRSIKITGVFLLLSGWTIVLTAVAVLRPGAAQGAFATAGAVVEVIGLGMLFRAHRVAREEER
jgi:hypothetical protein